GHVLKEIRERSPSPTISAGIVGGESSIPVALSSVIGKNRARMPQRGGWPVKTRIIVQRLADGEAKVLWNGRFPQSRQLPGDLQQVSLVIHKAGAVPIGT